MIEAALRSYTYWHYRRWEKALQNPQQAQKKVLKDILALQKTIAPKNWNNHPLSTYETYNLPHQQLTHQSPLTYEPTSGSSGAKKEIPYTPALLKSFTHMFLVWSHDALCYLKQKGTPFSGGQIYFSVSPQFSDTKPNSEKTGLADDSDYLRGPSAWISKRFLAVSPRVKYLKQPDNFWDVICLSLLRAPRLEIISVWSPSFLRVLQAHLQTHSQRLSLLLQTPTLNYEGLLFELPQPSNQRYRELTQAMAALPKKWAWNICFPHLKFISCWGAENAAVDFNKLKKDFSFAHVQEKGLLATEAPMTIPSEKHGGFLPLLDEVFFEFLPVIPTHPDKKQTFLLHELKDQQDYEIIVSQKSGLLRYRLKDRVQVQGKYKNTPFLVFKGRTENVSDLVGEKLNSHFVSEGFKKIFYDQKMCLVPDTATARYVLLSETKVQPAALRQLEAYLCGSPHYVNARKLGQLQALKSMVHPRIHEFAKAFFIHERSMKRGDIKDQVLYAREQNGQLLRYLERLAS